MATKLKKISLWRAGRGMPPRLGPLLGGFAQRFLRSIPYADPDRVDRLRELSRQGNLVYVHRSRNVVDFLYLSAALHQHRLPLAAFVGGLRVGLFQPIKLLLRWRLPAGAPDDPIAREEFLLGETMARGRAAQIFLKRPLTLTNPRPTHRADYVRALIEAQRTQERPIFLVPQLLVFSQQPGRFIPTLGDTVFGSPEEPGTLRALVRLFTQRRKARLLVGEPLDLKRFLADHPQHSDAVLTKKVRWMLLHYLAREDRVFNGPPLKSPARMRQATLRDPSLQALLDQLEQRHGQPRALLQRQTNRIYDEIAARFGIGMINFMDLLMTLVFRRIYDGIVTPPEDLARLREAMRRASVVLVPSHRSHIDYLVLSYVMAHNGMIPPHIAAGVNLSFWPLGAILRRAGAFFLRRTFKGDPLYSTVFRAYLKRLLREGFPQEFFIEGTRSRTGKSLQPRLGMLSMLVEAFLEAPHRDLLFVPISFGYEKVIEEGAYERELMGGAKQRENVAGLIKATGVLRSRYGRVYMFVDEPISLTEFLEDRGVDLAEPTPEERRDAVEALSRIIVQRIDRSAPVTPTAVAATAILGHPARSLTQVQLVEFARRIIHHIQQASGGRARLTAALDDLEGAMRVAADRLSDEGTLVVESAGGDLFLRPREGRRHRLDRYKNSVLHFFAGESILATALEASAAVGKPVPLDAVRRRGVELLRLLRLEFVLPLDVDYPALFDLAVTRAEENGYLVQARGRVAVPEDARARALHRFVANLIAPLVEGYWIALRSAAALTDAPIGKRELAGRIRDAQRASFLAGETFYEESISKVLAENAVARLIEMGALTAGTEGAGASTGALRRGADWDHARLLAVADEVSRYLP